MLILSPKIAEEYAAEEKAIKLALAFEHRQEYCDALSLRLMEIRTDLLLTFAKLRLITCIYDEAKSYYLNWRAMVILQINLGMDIDLDDFESYDAMFINELDLKLSDLGDRVEH